MGIGGGVAPTSLFRREESNLHNMYLMKKDTAIFAIIVFLATTVTASRLNDVEVHSPPAFHALQIKQRHQNQQIGSHHTYPSVGGVDSATEKRVPRRLKKGKSGKKTSKSKIDKNNKDHQKKTKGSAKDSPSRAHTNGQARESSSFRSNGLLRSSSRRSSTKTHESQTSAEASPRGSAADEEVAMETGSTHESGSEDSSTSSKGFFDRFFSTSTKDGSKSDSSDDTDSNLFLVVSLLVLTTGLVIYGAYALGSFKFANSQADKPDKSATDQNNLKQAVSTSKTSTFDIKPSTKSTGKKINLFKWDKATGRIRGPPPNASKA